MPRTDDRSWIGAFPDIMETPGEQRVSRRQQTRPVASARDQTTRLQAQAPRPGGLHTSTAAPPRTSSSLTSSKPPATPAFQAGQSPARPSNQTKTETGGAARPTNNDDDMRRPLLRGDKEVVQHLENRDVNTSQEQSRRKKLFSRITGIHRAVG